MRKIKVVMITSYFDRNGVTSQVMNGKIAIAIIFGTIASLLVKNLTIGNFLTLVVSAILFFGIYAIVLLILKEKFFMEIVNETVLPILYKLRGCEKNG